MKYDVQASTLILTQIKRLKPETKRILRNKIELLTINPFRNKRIKGYNLFLLRIRFKDNKKEKRMIYFIDKPNIKLLCILDRGNDYKDLTSYLKRLGYR